MAGHIDWVLAEALTWRAGRSSLIMDNGSFSWDLIIRVSVVLFAGYLAYHFLLGGARTDFVIRLRNGHVTYKGFAAAHQPAVTQFLLQDMALHGSVIIMGSRHGGKTRIWFRGRLSREEKQRIRNFLTSRL
jgi:hypothetical protein